MTNTLDFQSIILELQHFWAEQGCLIWQPYYTQVGAGTMNPATFLRVLGPEPWKVAYVEPSIRPDDARYGENPNRMQMHYQFQVILKPDPGYPQEIYLDSLERLGIDTRQHDIRFVEDNWEAPSLGAWGLGWEVWLDGQEITQFTYFQQAGGITLNPVSVEITYGLDRIAIALQRVHGFTDIQWNARFTAGDVNFQGEQEHSKYFLEVANVERLRQMFALFEAEAQAALTQKLVLPAHDYVLKCSHTFNVLDTRGAIGVTERQAFLGRMRDLSRQVAETFLEQRQRLEFPWLEEEIQAQPTTILVSSISPEKEQESSLLLEKQSTAPFLLEIGMEELPASDLDSAIIQLKERVQTWLEELRLNHGDVHVMGTQRRLVVYVEQLSARQASVEQVIKGPPASRSFDVNGQPTQAAVGFAKSRGVGVSNLQVKNIDGGSYLVAVVNIPGESTTKVLENALPGLISSLKFENTMRWNSSGVAFSRPIRWLLALFSNQVVPFEYAGLRAGRETRGLRTVEPLQFEVQTAEEYFSHLSEQGIILDADERKSVIWDQVKTLASAKFGAVVTDQDLLAEVASLVEAPKIECGSFDPVHLKLPSDVLIAVMKKHQRYFPVEKEGKLLPYFIFLINGDERNLIQVVNGNEHVVRARFVDAAYFIHKDLQTSLEDFLPQLDRLTFQVDLGSMLDKTHRIQRLVADLSEQLGLDDKQLAIAQRAAKLSKADLVTSMVVEMTALQGIMGNYYATEAGEPEAVTIAIKEHYLPRYTGDVSPTTLPGLVVGLADRLDTLAGLFGVGLAPTGTKDPFALRRAALGLIQSLLAWDLDFDLRLGLKAAASYLPLSVSDEKKNACLGFIIERLRFVLLEEGFRYDVVEAVLTIHGHNPAMARRAVLELSEWVERHDWHTILPAYARCVRITRDQTRIYPINGKFLIEPGERNLFLAWQEAHKMPYRPGSVDDFLNHFLPMIPAVNRFFDEVLVMTEDANMRENRLGLLQAIVALAAEAADFSKLEGF